MDEDRARVWSDDRIGKRFGDYLVEDQIGRGGMGVVFRARHEITGAVVALKLMAPDLAHNEAFRERFIREAEAGPDLGHPNIVPVFGSGEADGELFIAMELIEGTDLKGVIKHEGRLDPKRVLSIFKQAASALDAAHESGMVHRDVKPQNILVIPRESPADTDQVYLTDFGLVRPVTSETSASRTGQVFGSVAYMAPELIEGIPADGRADVYALGCVLYECLTGEVPFERANEVSAVWAHIHEDPPLLTDTCRDLPGGLNDVVFKAMAKHPDDRFLTAGEFVGELERGLGRKLSHIKYAHVRPLVTRVPRRKTEREVWAPNFFPELSRVRAASRERFNWRKAAALVAAFLALSTVQVGREGGLPQAITDVAEAAGSTGNRILKSAFDGPTDNEETGARADRDREAEAMSDAHVPKVKVGGENLELLQEAPSPQQGTASELPPPPPQIANGRVAFHRFSRCTPGIGCDPDIYSVRTDGTGLVNLTPGTLFGAGPVWSPDGRRIMFTGWDAGFSDIYVMNGDGSGLRNLTNTINASEGTGSWSPDGKRIVFAKGNEGVGIWVMNADGSDRRQVTSSDVGDLDPQWSPTGDKIAFYRSQCGSNDADTCGIFVVDVHGNEVVRLGAGRSPKWSPDGRKIAFDRATQSFSTSDIFTMNADGSDERNLTSSDRFEISPSWSPDGRYLVFQNESFLATIAMRTGKIRQLTYTGTCNSPSWQPQISGR